MNLIQVNTLNCGTKIAKISQLAVTIDPREFVALIGNMPETSEDYFLFPYQCDHYLISGEEYVRLANMLKEYREQKKDKTL